MARRRQHIARILVTGLLAALSACAAPRAADEGPHPSWPAPPAEPRIVHVRDVHGREDLGRPGFLQGLGAAITGRQSQAMIRPHAIAVGENTLYVTDQELQGILIFEMDGSKARFLDRVGDKHLVSPTGIALCGDTLAVADGALADVFLLDRRGKLVGTLQKDSRLGRPTGLAWDAPRQELYVSDTLHNEVYVFDLQGTLKRKFGGSGNEPGKFSAPTHLAVSGDVVCVSDSLNFRVQIFDTQGRYRTEIGKHGDASGHMAVPKGVALDRYGHLYVVDSYLSNVQIFNLEGQLLLSLGRTGAQRGEFQVPAGIAVSPDDRIFVCDGQNRRVQVFQYLGGQP